MGTTLTGTTPQDTYDSLIKVTDNGPLTGSLKVLTDGLGNDSALALSTGAASVTGTLAVSSGITSTGANTMLSASSSTEGLVVRGGSSIGTPTTTSGQILIGGTGSYRGSIAYDDNAGYLYIDNLYNNNAGNIYFRTKTQGTAVEALTILGSGNVGIGTDAPQQKLHVASVADDSYGLMTTALNWPNNIFTGVKIGSTGDTYSAGVDLRSYSNYSTSAKTALALWVNNTSNTMVEVIRATENGLTFNGDTAAANALDDYEEGTWTPIVTDLTNDATMISGTTGFYTKIGRQVTLSGYVRTTSIGSVSGDVYIGGMPFTSNGSLGSETSVTFGYFTAMNLGAAEFP